MNATTASAFALAFVQLTFAVYAVIQKSALNAGLDAGELALIRDVGISIVLIGLCRLLTGTFGWPHPGEQFKVMVLGICGLYFGQYFAILGLRYGTPVLSSTWSNASPAATFLVGLLLRTERCSYSLATCLKLVGLLLVVGGAMVATFAPRAEHEDNVVLASLFFSLQMFVGNACFWHLQKDCLNQGHSPLLVAAWYYSFGAAQLFLVIAPSSLQQQQQRVWGWLDAVAIGFGIIVYPLCAFLLTWANKHTSPVTVMGFSPLQIAATCFLEWLIHRNYPTNAQFAGSAIIVIGVAFLICSRLREHAKGSSEHACRHMVAA